MIDKDDLIDFDKDIKVQPDEKEPMTYLEYLNKDKDFFEYIMEKGIPLDGDLLEQFKQRKRINDKKKPSFNEIPFKVINAPNEPELETIITPHYVTDKKDWPLSAKKFYYYVAMNKVDNPADYIALMLEMVADVHCDELFDMFGGKVEGL